MVPTRRWTPLCILLAVTELVNGSSATLSISWPTPTGLTRLNRPLEVTTTLRGGGGGDSTKKTKKKKRRTPEKTAIDNVLKKDAGEVLADAIRSSADELRSSPLTSSIDDAVSSLGWAMGASDRRLEMLQKAELDSGGVEISSSSVIVHYFLKSHGGAHALQSLCGILASLAGLAAMLLASSPLSLVLMKRACLFAMVKHVSGLLAASFLTAKAIPEIGLSQARRWMQELAADPVSQYVFYAATILVWLPGQPNVWWRSYPLATTILMLPIVLREFVSTLLVLSDVLVLAATTGQASSAKRLLQGAHNVVSAVMCILTTPKVWKAASAVDRQAILAKLISRFSLAVELAVGVLMTMDALSSVVAFLLTGTGNQRPSFYATAKQLVCVRWYWQFLWTRRRRIRRLATRVRGGAAQLPFYVLNVLLDPRASMGLEASVDDDERDDSDRWRWKDYVRVALEMDDR